MKTRNDVFATIEKLCRDLAQNPDSWENPTLERYLEAMGRWLEDSSKKNPQPPSWEFIIQMLEAAKIYE
jgi:hypothetical protein